MFCPNCGNQIPDNTRFCAHCGAMQQGVVNATPAATTTEYQQRVADTPTQQAEQTPKKKNNILIVLAIALCCFLVGKLVIGPSMVSEPDDDTGNHSNQSQQSSKDDDSSFVGSANSAYTAIFDDAYIVHFQTFANLEMESFALKQDDGIIACADYGYKDDVVKHFVETVYIPVSGYTDDQKAEIETTYKTQFASIDALNCCVVTYKMSANHFTITCTYSDVDQASNYAELYNAGVLQTNTFISMSETETNLLRQGFVKK